VSIQTRVSVTVEGGESADFFDASDPRLLAALGDTERLVGHPVELVFHFAMLPRPRGHFLDELFERTIRNLPRGLAEAAGWSPELWAWAAPSLRRVAIDYDGSEAHTGIRFDAATGCLCVELGGSGGFSAFGVADALRGAFWELLALRYDEVGADALPAEERSLYAYYLEHVAPRGLRGGGSDALRAPHARAISEGTVLYDRFAQTDRELGARLERWLLAQVRFFHDVSSVDGDAVRRAPPDSQWTRAVRLWSRWVVARFDRLPDAAQLALLQASVIDGDDGRNIGTLDPLELWRGIVGRWIRAGGPVAEDSDADVYPQALFEHAVCPWRPPVTGGSHPDEGIHCRRNLVYPWALADPARFERLIALVLQANHPGLTAAVVGSVVRLASLDEVLQIWRALEVSDVHARVATRVVAEEIRSNMYLTGARRDLWWVSWQQVREATLRTGTTSPYWLDFKTYLEEIGMADSYDEVVTAPEAAALQPARALLGKLARMLTPFALEANEIWRGSGWPCTEKEVRDSLLWSLDHKGTFAIASRAGDHAGLGAGLYHEPSTSDGWLGLWLWVNPRRVHERAAIMAKVSGHSWSADWHTDQAEWELFGAYRRLVDLGSHAEGTTWLRERLVEVRDAGVLDELLRASCGDPSSGL
jgi:hypothetical protein